MYAITGDICYVLSCPKCSFTDIRLYYPLKAYQILQSFYDRGHGKCDRCKNREGMKVALLKKDIAEQLRKNFPNKKVIYTKKSIEELLTLKDLDTIPTIEGE